VALKPAILTGIAILGLNISNVISLGGLGTTFTKKGWRKATLKKLISVALRWVIRLNNTSLILQNSSDVSIATTAFCVPSNNIHLIQGVGVDIDKFRPRDSQLKPPFVVLFAARLLAPKGIFEFVEAAKTLLYNRDDVKFHICGRLDPLNSDSLTESDIEDWNGVTGLEYLGSRSDMSAVFSSASIVCLPTYYGEGLPKVLIEGAACGIPIITTDMPGCNDIVVNGHNGIIIESRNTHALIDALNLLLNDVKLRKIMGENGRALVIKKFSEEKCSLETLNVYDKEPISR
jgi:glycosyltransferase involved in cell wall biosynthesis